MVPLALLACSSPRLPAEAQRPPPLVTRLADGPGGIDDQRAAFRQALCGRLAHAGGPDCSTVLTRMGAEGDSGHARFDDDATLAARFRLAIVPGFLAECLPPAARPFADAVSVLRARGFELHYLQVAGRGSVHENAQQLQAQLAALPDDPRPLVIVAYSKGLPDLLAALAEAPERQAAVAAVVSLAGAFNGSLLAERYAGLYHAALMRLPLQGCAAGDGSELDDLRREVRHRAWLAQRERIRVPLFSLVAVPEQRRVSALLAPAHAQLSELDPYNDGQMLWTDALATPGTLLGYVNADHWGLAMNLSEALPGLGWLIEDQLPRGDLLAAALQVVAARLDRTAKR